MTACTEVSVDGDAREPTGLPQTKAAKCKRRQYESVRSALQFLCPLLTAYVDATPLREELCEGHWDLIHQLVSTGVPPSLSHSGPLSFAHLHLLTDPAWDDILSRVFSRLPRSVLMPSRDSAGTSSSSTSSTINVYPIAALSAEATRTVPWTAALVDRYVDARTRVHADRPSRNLSEAGYLHEAGLLARDVFGSDDTTADAGDCAQQRARWVTLVDSYSLFLPDRSHIHELENLPQEIAIGELLASCAQQLKLQRSPSAEGSASGLTCVVDVGGGNGILAAQLSERLGCPGVIIDPFFPSHALDYGSRVWTDTPVRRRPPTRRRQPFRRVVASFGESDWSRDVGADQQSSALVAKHLCGTAVDASLAHLASMDRLPRVLLLAPCCFNKGLFDEYVGQRFLNDVLHVHDQDAYTAAARLTDWNQSVYQRASVHGTQEGRRTFRGRDAGGRCSRKSLNFLVPCAETLARVVEGMLNAGRVQWLEERGYVVSVREYVPDCVTPKNKCIVAYRP